MCCKPTSPDGTRTPSAHSSLPTKPIRNPSILEGREVFGGLPDGRARLGGRVERHVVSDVSCRRRRACSSIGSSTVSSKFEEAIVMKCGGKRYAGKRILTARLYLRARRMAVRARSADTSRPIPTLGGGCPLRRI